MDCSEIHRFLHAYIDLEFDEREEIEFELHLGQCRSCREEVNYYRALRRTLRQKMPAQVAPLRMETMIRETLVTEERIQRGWWSLSMATVGAFVFAIATFLWSSHVYEEPQTPASAPMLRKPTVAQQNSHLPKPQQHRPLLPVRDALGATSLASHISPVEDHIAQDAQTHASTPMISVHECSLEQPRAVPPPPAVVHAPWCTGQGSHNRRRSRSKLPQVMQVSYSSQP